MMVLFLVGLVSMILMRTLRKDYARYSKEEELDDLERDLGDEYGWKQIHGDVFRLVIHFFNRFNFVLDQQIKECFSAL
jgi:transmembrane 9 superfamily protein 3